MIEKTYIIGITGKMMSGKDTAADYLADALIAQKHQIRKSHLSDPMKEIVKTIWGKETWSIEGKKAFIVPGLTGRDALQQISSFFRGLDPQAWIRAMETYIKKHDKEQDIIIISDVRLPIETELCDYVLKIDRPSQQSAPKKEQQHETETGVDEIQPDSIVVNNGSLMQLQNQMKNLSEIIMEKIHD